MLGEKNLADALTVSRLYAIIPISVTAMLGLQKTTGVLYLLAVLTDLFDGMVARKQGTASKNGSDLDGVVDFWFSLATLWWLYLLTPETYTQHGLAILLGVAVFGAFMIISKYATGEVHMLHTYSAKATTALFGLWIPLAAFLTLPGWFVWLTVAAAIISRVENTVKVLRKNPTSS